MDCSPVGEGRLIAAAHGGDEAAFEQLWHAHTPNLRRYLRSLGLHDVDDVVNQTWLEVFPRLDRIDSRPDGLRRLLFTVARRRMIDVLRHRRAHPAPVEPTIADDRHDDPDPFGLEAALGHLATLPVAQAEVLALRVIVGMSVAEVAELTDRTPGAVRVMAHRALTSLRERLSASADEPSGPFEDIEVTDDVARTISP